MALVVNGIVFMLRIILTYFRPISNTILDFLYFVLYGRSKALPVIDNKILLMSATELAEKIRNRMLSAEEVMQIYICRIKAVQPILNVCTDNRFEEAIADAKAVDQRLKTTLKTKKELAQTVPLLGVPFTCKEIVGVKDLLQTWGLLRFKNRKAPEDADAVAQYKKAGAIPVVVTNIPTFCLWWDTSNLVFGQTKNPYDNHRTVGGSSGGEAALISSASAIIGIGTDLGGSIRIPSSFCGIYGHKPSEGIISNKTFLPELPNVSDSLVNIDRFQSTGPMCRYVEDLNLLVSVLLGKDQRKLQLSESLRVNFRQIKIYYMEEFPGCLLSATSDVKASVREAVEHFEKEYNITASKLKLDELKFAFEIWQCKMFEACGAFQWEIMTNMNRKFNLCWEFLKCFLGYSEFDHRLLYYVSIEIQKKGKFYERYLNMYKTIEKKLAEVLDGDAILILPVHPEPPPHPIVTIPKFKNIAYTCIFNILGLPATTIPAGLSEGVPIGLQVLAKKHNDHLTLSAALELNKIFGGWRVPCPVLL